MAGNDGTQTSVLQLELIRDQTPTEQEAKILDIVNSAMDPATPETAMEAARQLDEICPPLQDEADVGHYCWNVWSLMIDVARSPDATSAMRERLIRIMECLSQHHRAVLNSGRAATRILWADLPVLSECLDVYFEDPTVHSDAGIDHPKSDQIWINMNAFKAQCLAAGVVDTYADAMHALSSALEEESDQMELKVLVACEWIRHASEPLLCWARNNIGYTDVPEDDELNYVEPGPLYQGPSTMCLRRWGYWQGRFKELAKEASGVSEATREAALEAARTMKKVEASVGNTLGAG